MINALLIVWCLQTWYRRRGRGWQNIHSGRRSCDAAWPDSPIRCLYPLRTGICCTGYACSCNCVRETICLAHIGHSNSCRSCIVDELLVCECTDTIYPVDSRALSKPVSFRLVSRLTLSMQILVRRVDTIWTQMASKQKSRIVSASYL